MEVSSLAVLDKFDKLQLPLQSVKKTLPTYDISLHIRSDDGSSDEQLTSRIQNQWWAIYSRSDRSASVNELIILRW